ncbi:MAG: nucleotide exchange factor GrpE [Acidobacteriota bacterium]|nr:nucleotide exchange factor GrpE [Acidobacteriota bacterium]
MAPDKKGQNWNRIPIDFLDSDREGGGDDSPEDPIMSADELDTSDEGEEEVFEAEPPAVDPSPQADGTPGEVAPSAGGPEVAELVASRAELKRLEGEVKELRESLARRQADFENYRKRMERERGETYNRVVADIAAKLLPVLDNLKRALETEASVEASESDEFRHFLSGVDLIYKQLNGVLDAFGVKPVLAEGEQFNPHLHEAVVTEPTDEYEPDTVIQEIVPGFRLGDKLIRPALVKVAVKK